jgi:hypothetical protein
LSERTCDSTPALGTTLNLWLLQQLALFPVIVSSACRIIPPGTVSPKKRSRHACRLLRIPNATRSHSPRWRSCQKTNSSDNRSEIGKRISNLTVHRNKPVLISPPLNNYQPIRRYLRASATYREEHWTRTYFYRMKFLELDQRKTYELLLHHNDGSRE